MGAPKGEKKYGPEGRRASDYLGYPSALIEPQRHRDTETRWPLLCVSVSLWRKKSEERRLSVRKPAEGFGGKRGAAAGDSVFPAGNVEQLVDLIRKNTFAPHALAEIRSVQLPTADRTKAVQHVFLPIR